MVRRGGRTAVAGLLGLVVTVGTAVVGLVAGPAQAAEWDPPAPTASDLCGTKWDRVWIPEDGYTDYRINGDSVAQGTYHPLSGASTVEVVAKNYIDPDKTFTLMFDTGPDSSCPAALPNTVEVVSRECWASQGVWKVGLNYRNTPDNTWPVVNPTMYFLWSAGTAAKDDRYLGEVADGATVAMITTLLPGTHTVTEIHPDLSETNLGTVFAGGPCGNEKVPPGDPSGLGGPLSVPGAAQASVTKSSCKAVKVSLDNRGVKAATKFTVVVKGKPKRKVTRTVAKNGSASVKIKTKKPKKVTVKATTSGRTRTILKQPVHPAC